jgi:hypothetical protein
MIEATLTVLIVAATGLIVWNIAYLTYEAWNYLMND